MARAQEETSAAVKMLILRGSPGFSGVKPVSASLQRADMGGSLSTRELLDIASVLRCARGARDYGCLLYTSTREQLTQAFRRLKELGAEEFGIHAFLASNTLSNDYYPALARILFRVAVELKEETGCHITFINLSGGVGVPYRPEQPANDIAVIGEGVRRAYEEVLVPAGMGDAAICTCLLYTSWLGYTALPPRR